MSMRHLDVSQHDSAQATAQSSLEANHAGTTAAAAAAFAADGSAVSDPAAQQQRRRPHAVRMAGGKGVDGLLRGPTSLDAMAGKAKMSLIPNSAAKAKGSKIPSPEKDGTAVKGVSPMGYPLLGHSRSKKSVPGMDDNAAGASNTASGKSSSNVSQFVHPLLRNNKAALEHVQRIKTGEGGRTVQESNKQQVVCRPVFS
jgi:hypothetical protein